MCAEGEKKFNKLLSCTVTLKRNEGKLQCNQLFYCTLSLFYELWSESWQFVLELHIFTQFHYFTLHNHIPYNYCNNVRNI